MMKKRFWMLILAAVMAMVCLSAAGEEQRKILDFTIECGAGETTMPDYPDFAEMIGEGLTDDDFDITYPVKNWVTFDADGRVTVSSDAYAGGGYYTLDIVYSPKVEGVGETTAFNIRFKVLNPLTQVYMDATSIETNMDYTRNQIETWRPSGTRSDWVADISYDSSVVQVTEWDNFTYKYFYFTNVGPGKTDVVITAYNGMKIVIPVVVHPATTQVKFAASYFQVSQGETVDIGLDLGNGSIVPSPSIKIKHDDTIYSEGWNFAYHTYFLEDATHFYAKTLGLHEITVTTTNGLSGQTMIYVTGNQNCASMAAEEEPIYVRNTVTIKQFDAEGKRVYVPLKITAGADKAKLVGDRLTAKKAGEVEVTATNPDGTKVSMTLVIEVTPTEMHLEETEVTLEIGETYEPKVIFDQGSLPCSLVLNKQDATDQRLYTTRAEGMKIIAQAPGTAVYTVRAGDLSQQITITVPDSDKAVHIVKPAEPFPAKHSCQIYVQDKAGRVYPATFSSTTPDYYGVISPAGYYTSNITGVNYFSISATLEDGRRLHTSLYVRTIPEWIRRTAVIIRKSETREVGVSSDVGEISSSELTFEVADEKIITIENGIVKPKKIGKTTVTATSIYNPEATTTFTVEVISDSSQVYIGTTSMNVPCGASRYMPAVYNEKGKEVTMVWKITHNNPGEGNSEESGFTIEDGVITCTWPTATCEVTGTVKGSSKKVMVFVKGYQLPENITIEPLQVWLEPGETQTLTLATEDKHGGWGISYWESENAAIASVEPYVEGRSNTITAVAPGTTLVAAMLENGATAFCLVNVYDPNARLPGDVNEDGAVDAKDALIIMQYDAGWPVLINGWQGDVNADGSTNLADALMIFQHDAGFDVQLKQYIPEE